MRWKHVSQDAPIFCSGDTCIGMFKSIILISLYLRIYWIRFFSRLTLSRITILAYLILLGTQIPGLVLSVWFCWQSLSTLGVVMTIVCLSTHTPQIVRLLDQWWNSVIFSGFLSINAWRACFSIEGVSRWVVSVSSLDPLLFEFALSIS